MRNRDKNKASSKEALIIGGILFGLLFLGYYFKRDTDDELNRYGEITSAIVIDTDYQISKGYYLTYKFSINGKWFKNHQQMVTERQIGDTLKILYSTKNPKRNRIIW